MRRQLSARGVVLLAAQLLAGEHVPQPELGLEPAVGLGVTRPVTSAWALICRQSAKRGSASMVEIFSMIGGLIDRREQAGALQVGGDDLAHVARRRGVLQSDRR